MRAQDIVRLVVLAAIWGASFLFMRVIADALGVMTTACSRVLIAGVVLCSWFAVAGIGVEWRRHWREYAVIGVVNSAVPFSLYAFAAQHIPASYSAIMNSLAPMFGMALGVVWLGARPSVVNLVGAVVGIAGVTVIAWKGPMELTGVRIVAICACAAAAACYAIAGVYMKKRAGHLRPIAVAGASQLVAGVVLLPGAVVWPAPGPITPVVIGAALALALVCSGVAYVLYYRLLADCGPTRALTVTYLIPVFGVLWSVVFLREALTVEMVCGCALVVAGTMLVVRKSGVAREKGAWKRAGP